MHNDDSSHRKCEADARYGEKDEDGLSSASLVWSWDDPVSEYESGSEREWLQGNEKEDSSDSELGTSSESGAAPSLSDMREEGKYRRREIRDSGDSNQGRWRYATRHESKSFRRNYNTDGSNEEDVEESDNPNRGLLIEMMKKEHRGRYHAKWGAALCRQ